MKRSGFLLILLSLSLLIAGCANSQKYGKLVRSVEIDRLVESATVLPGYTYYYTGPEAEPDAIIAIKNELALKSKYWIKVDSVAEQLQDWNRFIANDTRYRKIFEGAQIITPDNQQVGIWYSRYDHTVVQFPDHSSIVVYAPLVPLDSRERHLNLFRTP